MPRKSLHAVDFIPHKRLIHTLLLAKYSNANLNDFLKDHGFPLLQDNYYTIMLSRFKTAYPEHFKSPDTIDSESIRLAGISDMYAYLFDKRYFTNSSPPLECFEDAFKAWGTPKVCKALKAMAFAQISEEEIELYSNAKWGDGYDSEVYMIFFKYFFDPFEWSYQTRAEYMENELNRDMKRMYKLGLTKDPDFIVWKLGLAPTKSFADMLEVITRDCFYNFKEQTDINPDSANRWGQLMLKAMDKIKEVEPDDHKATFGDDFRIQLKSIDVTGSIKTKDELDIEIPDLKEMEGGKGPSFKDIEKAMENAD